MASNICSAQLAVGGGTLGQDFDCLAPVVVELT